MKPCKQPRTIIEWAGLAVTLVIALLVLSACNNDDAELASLVGESPAYVNTPGAKTNIPESYVLFAGWSVCYSDTYDVTGPSLAGILAGCAGSQLMLACRPVGAANFTLLAQAARSDVITDTTTDTTTVHVANGTAWYYNDGLSWGFASPGDGVGKTSWIPLWAPILESGSAGTQVREVSMGGTGVG